MREFRRSQFGDIISAPFSRRRLGGALIKITFHFQPESPVPFVLSPARRPASARQSPGFPRVLSAHARWRSISLWYFAAFIAAIRISYSIMKKMIALEPVPGLKPSSRG